MAVAVWAGDAACVGRADLFFPREEEDGEERFLRERAALSLCAACPVREPCLRFAVSQRIREGVWGGLRDVERRGLRESGVTDAARAWSPSAATHPARGSRARARSRARRAHGAAARDERTA